MAKSYEELKNEISAIANEVEDGANTANRIGGAMDDIVDYTKESLEAQEERINEDTDTKISGLVVQETGDGEGVVMSQKAVTEKLTELESELGKNTIFRQGTFTNFTNTTTVTSRYIVPFVGRLFINTNRPIEDGYEYRYGFATYEVNKSEVSNGLTILRRVNSQPENYADVQDGEKGIAFAILKYHPSTDTYAELSIDDFSGYKIEVSPYSELISNIAINGTASNSLSQLRGKVFSIIGDSISSFEGYCIENPYYPTTNSPADIKTIDDIYWKKLINASSAKLGVNASFGGARVTNTRPSGTAKYSLYERVSMVGLNGTPDVIIVELGTNDSIGGVAIGNFDYELDITEYDESQFAPAYIKGIKSLLTTYPSAKIVCMSLSMDTSYSEAIRKIAEHYNLIYINVPYYTTCDDGYEVHPDNIGMATIAEKLMRYEEYNQLSTLANIGYADSFVDNFQNLSSRQILGDLPLCSPVNGFLKDPSIWVHNGKWYMYCTTTTEGTTNFDTDWYSSTDGKTWKYERRVFEHTGVNDYARYCQAATSKAILVNGLWHIWVTCWGTTNGWCIAHYTCNDIENPTWIADENNPIFYNESKHILDPYIVYENGVYYCFATHDVAEKICFATSYDCYTWSEMTDIPNVYGEGPMVMKAPNGKWIIMAAHAGGNSLKNEDIDVFESDSLTDGYSYIGKPYMQLPSWANVCYGHGDMLKIPAGHFGFAKDKYILYYQATWDGEHMVICTAISDDCYHWYPYNYGYYNWGDFLEIDNAGYLIIRKQNTLPNWKPFVRTYDYWVDFDMEVTITQLLEGCAGVVLFGESSQYLNCLFIGYDRTNQKLVAYLNPENNEGEKITYLELDDPYITSGDHIKLRIRRSGNIIEVFAFNNTGLQVGSSHKFTFADDKFYRVAIGLMTENSEGYFNSLSVKGNH